MALDAVAIRAIINELQTLVGGRISQVHQPERDEIVLSIRTLEKSYKLLICAGSANPRIHLTEYSKKNPKTAPLFCMLLRKHISSGKIQEISQVGFERIIRIAIDSYDELGDYTTKYLYVEIMGRHSNIVLSNSEGRIIDSVKRVDDSISSVREILPGGVYELPPCQEKRELIAWDDECSLDLSGFKADRALLDVVGGISPLTAREILYKVFKTTDVVAENVSVHKTDEIKREIIKLAEDVRCNRFIPCIIEDAVTGKLIEFSAMEVEQYETLARVHKYNDMNALVDEFYHLRDVRERMRQKTSDLTRLLNTVQERVSKKLIILQRTLAEAQNLDKYREKAELITANIYRIADSAKAVEVENYFDDMGTVKIELDPSLSPSQNAQRYFKKYSKAKTAQIEAAKQLREASAELEYIKSTLAMVETADRIEDVTAIRRELAEQGYIKHSTNAQKKMRAEASKPMHFISSDGFDIYVGRNNTQNDYLTLKFANSGDLWFHTKDIHGSHTVIKLGIDKDIPKETIIEAAQLAAYYSKARESAQVPVDYTQIKNIKKPNGAKPGMVIYDTYNTVYVTPKLIESVL